MELLSEQGLRVDGRRAHELRRIQSKMGVFQQADGSAYLEQGNTKILAAVYGPHEVRGSRSKVLHDQALVNCQFSMATFSTGERKRRPRGDRKALEMSAHLQQTFQAGIRTELYKKSQIDIFVEVLQVDGGVYCACVNAATLAIIDAGIPMRDYVCACTASLVRDTPLVDVSVLEENMGGPVLTLSSLPKTDKIVLLEMTGRFHADHLNKVMEVALKGCRDIHTIMDTVVRKHVSDVGGSLGWEN